MRIERHCGRERLLGSERLWRKMAKSVNFTGVLQVYGYGVSGRPGIEQRRAMRTGEEVPVTIADYGDNMIRVWLSCRCAVTDFRYEVTPLSAFAHELGHHVIRSRGKKMAPWIEEGVAERYGRMMLREFSRK